MKTRPVIAPSAAALLAFTLAACGQPAPPPETTAAPALEETVESPAATNDVVAAAIADPRLSTLVSALQAAGLVETLQGEGPFTVFAPTNEAFAAIDAQLQPLLAAEDKSALRAVLTYHVVPGRLTQADLAGATATPATVQGGVLSIDTTSGVKVGSAAVVQADIAASNGVIHVIDTVLLPPAQ